MFHCGRFRNGFLLLKSTCRFPYCLDCRAYKLIERGIPEQEIAFIHDAKTDEQKQALFNKVNDGKIRVMVGSTEKCGAGTNVQQRLVALHHLDAPYRPRDLEQRDGRGIRQPSKKAFLQPFFKKFFYFYNFF